MPRTIRVHLHGYSGFLILVAILPVHLIEQSNAEPFELFSPAFLPLTLPNSRNRDARSRCRVQARSRVFTFFEQSNVDSRVSLTDKAHDMSRLGGTERLFGWTRREKEPLGRSSFSRRFPLFHCPSFIPPCQTLQLDRGCQTQILLHETMVLCGSASGVSEFVPGVRDAHIFVVARSSTRT